MCSDLRDGRISEARFVEDCRMLHISASRIEAFIESLKKEDKVNGEA
jgi:hypothetical protein